MRLDEIIDLLPEAGLSLQYLGQHICGTWCCLLSDGNLHHASIDGDGNTPAECMADALGKAGFNVEDDGT